LAHGLVGVAVVHESYLQSRKKLARGARLGLVVSVLRLSTWRPLSGIRPLDDCENATSYKPLVRKMAPVISRIYRKRFQ
jgi:hypothetical protein